MRKHWTDRVRFAAPILCVAGSLVACGQTDGTPLYAYSNCRFSDGLAIVQTDSLAPGQISREVDTDSGPRQIDMDAGLRIMFAYPNTDFYANVKAEILPDHEFGRLRKFLMENFDHLAHGNTVNTAVHSPMNGFEVHGLDRDKLEGGVLGLYLLFRDSDHTVTTIYFLNQEPQDRKFQTNDEYKMLRDRFLNSYTACIQSNLEHLR